MKEDYIISGGLTGIGVIITFLTGIFTPLLYILIFFEILDYITGMIAAWLKDGWSSKEALRGAIKKVLYFALVAVGFGLDYIIMDASKRLDFAYTEPTVFGTLVLWFLLSTELISIVENLAETGIEVPFLTTALKLFREQIEKIANKDGKKHE